MITLQTLYFLDLERPQNAQMPIFQNKRNNMLLISKKPPAVIQSSVRVRSRLHEFPIAVPNLRVHVNLPPIGLGHADGHTTANVADHVYMSFSQEVGSVNWRFVANIHGDSWVDIPVVPLPECGISRSCQPRKHKSDHSLW